MANSITRTLLGLTVLACVAAMTGSGGVQESSTASPDEAGGQSLDGDRSVSELNDLLERKITSLQRARRSYHQTLRQKERAISDARSRLETLKRDVRKKKEQAEKKRARLQQRNETHEDLSQDVKKLKKQHSSLSDLADRLATRLREYVRGTVPYRRDSRLNPLKADALSLQEQPVQVLNTLWNRARKELNRSRNAEIYTKQVTLSGDRKKHARLVRIGHNILFYITEVGSEVGRAVRRDDGSWTWSAQTDPDRIRSFKQALDMIRDEARPVRLPLPVDLTSSSSSK